MKIKNKLRLGFGFLFVIFIFFGVTSLYYIQDISSSTGSILNNNYETLVYTKAMRNVLDQNTLPFNQNAIADFNKQLTLQEHNITEPGETGATHQLRGTFNQLSISKADLTTQRQLERKIRQCLNQIESVNMKAILLKNRYAKTTVNKATMYLSFIGAITFLILFSFSVSFPYVIIDPLRTLIESIREISEKNYSQRIEFNRKDEFGEVALAFNQMATRLNEWENSNLATIMSEKLRIETIIEQINDAIIGINESGEVLFINNAARNILKLTQKTIAGQNIGQLAKVNELLQSLLSNPRSGHYFKINVNGKANFFQLENRSITVPNLNNIPDTIGKARRPAGMVYILKNITEFRERDEAKTNFIATISHELKTPISSIKLSLKLLNDNRVGTINLEQKDLIEQINEDSNRLLKITGELLNLAQAETGNIQLNLVAAPPAQIAEHALKSVKFQADQKRVNIVFQPVTNLPQVYADVEKTAWVMVNLLSNALRYSEAKSSIIVSIKENNNRIEFDVQDFGKGIDEQYQQHLFDRYFQVPADQQSKNGSGLGLAISRDFIEAQNGVIWVESTPGTGSIFSFSLPVVA